MQGCRKGDPQYGALHPSTAGLRVSYLVCKTKNTCNHTLTGSNPVASTNYLLEDSSNQDSNTEPPSFPGLGGSLNRH